MGLASPALPFPFGGRCEGRQGPGPRMAAGARPSVLRRKEASSCSCVRVACTVVDVGGQGPLRAWPVHNGAAGRVPGMRQERKQAQELQRGEATCTLYFTFSAADPTRKKQQQQRRVTTGSRLEAACIPARVWLG